jgi:hypothetical protein
MTLDGRTGKPVPTPRIDLRTLDQIRVEMGRVYRDMRSGVIDSQHGTRLTYTLAQIGRVIELAEIERRIAQLEERNAD